MFWTFLKGQALSYFEHHLMRRLEAEDSDVPDNEILELVLRNLGIEYIPKRAICMQKYYMRWGLYVEKPSKNLRTKDEKEIQSCTCALLRLS
jgi:hypothetical protein